MIHSAFAFIVLFTIPMVAAFGLGFMVARDPTEGDYHGEWWYASLSDDRYAPKPWERRAYASGLRDGIKIIETTAHNSGDWQEPKDGAFHRLRRTAGRTIHARATAFENDGSKPV